MKDKRKRNYTTLISLTHSDTVKDFLEKLEVEKIEKIRNNMVKKINKQIEKYNLKGMSFYIYLLPFNDVDKDRAKIMEQLLTRISYKE